MAAALAAGRHHRQRPRSAARDRIFAVVLT
jgi:hypothetical protein